MKEKLEFGYTGGYRNVVIVIAKSEIRRLNS